MKVITVLFFVVVLLTACRGNKNKHKFKNDKEKSFYTNCEGMDYIRFPLILPYEAMCIDLKERDWTIDLKSNPHYYSSITNPEKIYVINETILVYSSDDTPVTNNELTWQWFVIIPSQEIEIGFSEKEEFEEYIKQIGISDVNWMTVNQTYKLFKETECLPWIEGCFEKNNLYYKN